jgi:hypothetical protein
VDDQRIDKPAKPVEEPREAKEKTKQEMLPRMARYTRMANGEKV